MASGAPSQFVRRSRASGTAPADEVRVTLRRGQSRANRLAGNFYDVAGNSIRLSGNFAAGWVGNWPRKRLDQLTFSGSGVRESLSSAIFADRSDPPERS